MVSEFGLGAIVKPLRNLRTLLPFPQPEVLIAVQTLIPSQSPRQIISLHCSQVAIVESRGMSECHA